MFADLDHRPAAARTDAGWNTHAYLTEYYSRVEPTEQLTLRFLAQALAGRPPVARALDFGAGPTLHHALALARYAREIHVADLLPQNLRAVRRWRSGAAAAHDWSPFTRAVLRCEGCATPTTDEVTRREALTRQRLTRILSCDARRAHPLGEDAARRYDCVTTFFCADSATTSPAEWMRYVRNIVSLLAPGGLLVMGALRRCHFWCVDGVRHPSPCIDERHMQIVLAAAGFERDRQQIEVGNVPDQQRNGFESILLVSAHARG